MSSATGEIGMRAVRATGEARGRSIRRTLRLRIGLWLLAAAPAPALRRRRLPSVRRLAALTGVHRNTAAAVYRDLERFGLVRCVQGSGTYAVRPLELACLPTAPVCSSPELRDLLRAETGWRVDPDCGDTRRPVCIPLDEAPPPGRLAVPLAPRGEALTALRRLRPGDDVLLVSASARLGELVRHVVRALNGPDVGLRRVEAPGRRANPDAGELGLADAACDIRFGTRLARRGFITLRLVADDGPRAG